MKVYSIELSEWDLDILFNLLDKTALTKMSLEIYGRRVHDETFGAIADYIEDNKVLVKE
jgi:hypothetical protein